MQVHLCRTSFHRTYSNMYLYPRIGAAIGSNISFVPLPAVASQLLWLCIIHEFHLFEWNSWGHRIKRLLKALSEIMLLSQYPGHSLACTTRLKQHIARICGVFVLYIIASTGCSKGVPFDYSLQLKEVLVHVIRHQTSPPRLINKYRNIVIKGCFWTSMYST